MESLDWRVGTAFTRGLLPGLKKRARGLAMDVAFRLAKAHVLRRVATAQLGREPFGYLFIDGILPQPFYAAMQRDMLRHKHGGRSQPRRQDNPLYVNRRYNLLLSKARLHKLFRKVFSDGDVKQAFVSKFYLEPNNALARSLKIHEEFEYVFTEPGRFQNIHVDIPPKYLSFVFYVPEHKVSREAEERNATVLYDRNLEPKYGAKFRANSVCVFAPHFYSYHGFAATIERDVIVMFYINPDDKIRWDQSRRAEEPPFEAIKDAVTTKLLRQPLIEYGRHPSRVEWEKSQCRINAPQGRVLKDEPAGGPNDA